MKHLRKKFEFASFLVGLGLLVYLVVALGPGEILSHLRAMGPGIAVILLLSAARNCARAASWYFSIEPGHRQISYWTVMNVMLAGEAIKYLTATGPILGEPAKAIMVRKRIPILHGASSIVVENLIYSFSVVLFIIVSLPALAWLALPDRVKLASLAAVVAMLVAFLLIWASVSRRSYFIARALSRAAKLRPSLGQMALRARQLEENIYSFYEGRRPAFYLILGVNMLAHLINVAEVCAILKLMGLPASVSYGLAVESGTKLINLAFFFVPTRAGVYEGGNALIFEALGLGPGAGLALAIVRKIRALLWAAYGLIVLFGRALER